MENDSCPHGLEKDLLTDGHVADEGTGWVKIEACTEKRKCPHGIYIPEGDSETSRYCGMCNPDAYMDGILRNTMSRRKPVSRVYPEERTMDTADYMAQNPMTRLATGREFMAQ